MAISRSLSDEAVLAEIGARIARHRLAQQLTQTSLAEQAGISKRTLERIEAGASVQMSSMIRVLRAIGLLPKLNLMIPEPGTSPIDLLQRKGRQRQRAAAPRHGTASDTTWTWDDDT